eukprot:TRINITY_DN5465_c0_g1_i8.p1 TRINITY_DN5465_c0_g1~~TRINITY_DN5465_c0_g1_i8.p1  ORF type:complete len:118 (-),score=26.18 TRINITY_DN5465_c0_g1_i8:63-416(-)
MSLAGRSSALKDISVVELLSHLTSEYHRYERERNKWQTETTKLQLKIKHLEDERRIQVDINKDLVRRIKLLEFALRTERSLDRDNLFITLHCNSSFFYTFMIPSHRHKNVIQSVSRS